MCKRRCVYEWSLAAFLLCVCIVLAGCGSRPPAYKPHDMTLSVRCSANCSFDVTVSDGRVYIETAELTRRNCSIRTVEANVTVACPADLSQWLAVLDRRHGYPAMLNASS